MSDGEPAGGGLGATMVLFGLLLAAWHANEWMKLGIVGDPPFTVDTMPEPDCDTDELEEEGLTLAECRQMALHLQDVPLSAPGWFRSFHMNVSAAGTVLALLSAVAGMALVDGRTRAAATALATLAALAAVDIAVFTGAVMAGPLIRQAYLSPMLLWFFGHLAMAVAALALKPAAAR